MSAFEELREIITADTFDRDRFVAFVEAQGGPDSLVDDNPLLRWAVGFESVEATQILLDMGGDIKNPALNSGGFSLEERALRWHDDMRIAEMLADRGGDFSFIRNHRTFGDEITKVVETMAAAEFLQSRGLISSEEFAAITDPAAQVRAAAAEFDGPITTAFWEANEQRFKEYENALGRTDLQVSPDAGDGLWQIADQYNEMMGDDVSVPDAVERIAAINNISLDALRSGERVLTTDDEIKIPLGPDDRFENVVVRTPESRFYREAIDSGHDSLWAMAEKYSVAMGHGDDVGAAFRAITEANGIDAAAALRDGYTLHPIDYDNPNFARSFFIIPVKDDFRAIPELSASPHGNENPTDLIVMEWTLGGVVDFLSGKDHHEDTTRVARGVGEALDPNADGGRVWAIAEQFQSLKTGELQVPDDDMETAIRILMRSDEARAGNVVFSYSLGGPYDDPVKEEIQFQRETSPSRYLEEQSFWDDLDPVIFESAGNDYHKGRVYQDGDAVFHGNRQMRVGAVGNYDGNPESVAWYSDSGADLCAPMTHNLGKQYHGTSFAAPYLASVYRVQSERHGRSDVLPEGLDYDELIATGMMTARRDIFERDRRDGDTQANPALFSVNGGSIPYHDRCGAGLVNSAAWDAANSELVALKRETGLSTGLVESFIAAGDHELRELEGENGTEYIYRITVPENMTLGRLTLNLPQERNSRGVVVMETPSGDREIIQQSADGLSSTRRFIMEDVKAGDEIILRTAQPLEEDAGLFLRGYEEGSAIAAIRDRMVSDGRLPKPLQKGYSGFEQSAEEDVDVTVAVQAVGQKQQVSAGITQ